MLPSAARLSLVASLVGCILGGCVLGGCASWQQSPPTAAAAPLPCLPDFPYRQGWLGGDAAYSVPLSATETLWLFGDSFVGEPGRENRRGSSLIHNSVGVSRCGDDGWHIDYYWGADAEGAPRAFFRELRVDREQRWWWLFDGFRYGGELYVGLLEVERSAPKGPLELPFRAVGMRLARVENPDASPRAWRSTTLPLWESSAALPGSAMVVHAGWLYLFTFLQQPDASSPRVLARLPLSALAHAGPALPEALEYLSQDGRWKPGLDPADARVLMDDNATEMSVVWRADLKRWLATYSHPNAQGQLGLRGPSKRVFVRTAVSLEGPWSAPFALFEIPEFQHGPDPALACYAAKEHRQFSRPLGIAFSYVCNLLTPHGRDPQTVLMRLLHSMNLYRPRAVTLALPAALLAHSGPAAGP